MFAHPKIEVIWNSAVDEISGSADPLAVTRVRLRDTVTQKMSQISVDGVFVAIGHTPNTSLFEGKLAMDKERYILTTPGSTQTSVPGVFAAGDVQDKIFRQAVTAAGSGCMSALEAERHLAHG
ncbi:MAG: NAD(P)/FAD-dependent oxidoreductase [Xanthobacteraceae bacterium]|nr:NAD(P)/FAD-dependent oxidoreductase [Xanthobacteraceae bacterium]